MSHWKRTGGDCVSSSSWDMKTENNAWQVDSCDVPLTNSWRWQCLLYVKVHPDLWAGCLVDVTLMSLCFYSIHIRNKKWHIHKVIVTLAPGIQDSMPPLPWLTTLWLIGSIIFAELFMMVLNQTSSWIVLMCESRDMIKKLSACVTITTRVSLSPSGVCSPAEDK